MSDLPALVSSPTGVALPAVATEPLTVSGPAGPLEALVEIPAGFDGAQIALVLHPHPLFGGTMTNKVVHMAARALHERGFATLKFNFRGVGSSAGEFDHGIGETEDALAAVDDVVSRWPGAQLSLIGFSFGSYVAFRAALRCEIRQLILIAPPVKRFEYGSLSLPTVPWVVIQGDNDEVVSCADVRAWAAQLTPPPRLEVMSGAGHFFHGRLLDLKALVQAVLV